MVVFETIADFKKMVGKELPIGNWYTITQEMITDFANATLDKQWIHVDETRASKESPFKSTIAHGFMSVSMISKLLEEVFTIQSLKMGLNYGLNKVRFPNAVPVNSQLRILSKVSAIEDLANNGIKVTILGSELQAKIKKVKNIISFLIVLIINYISKIVHFTYILKCIINIHYQNPFVSTLFKCN